MKYWIISVILFAFSIICFFIKNKNGIKERNKILTFREIISLHSAGILQDFSGILLALSWISYLLLSDSSLKIRVPVCIAIIILQKTLIWLIHRITFRIG